MHFNLKLQWLAMTQNDSRIQLATLLVDIQTHTQNDFAFFWRGGGGGGNSLLCLLFEMFSFNK